MSCRPGEVAAFSPLSDASRPHPPHIDPCRLMPFVPQSPPPPAPTSSPPYCHPLATSYPGTQASRAQHLQFPSLSHPKYCCVPGVTVPMWLTPCPHHPGPVLGSVAPSPSPSSHLPPSCARCTVVSKPHFDFGQRLCTLSPCAHLPLVVLVLRPHDPSHQLFSCQCHSFIHSFRISEGLLCGSPVLGSD